MLYAPNAVLQDTGALRIADLMATRCADPIDFKDKTLVYAAGLRSDLRLLELDEDLLQAIADNR